MSFIGEFASYKPLRRIVGNEKITERLKEMQIKKIQPSADVLERKYIVDKHDVSLSSYQPNMIVAIDGSYQAVTVKNGFPGAECGYVTVASVLLDLKRAAELESQEFIDPKDFRTIEQATSLDAVFPGCNIILQSEKSVKASFRKVLFEEMRNFHIFEDTESLLDTYEALLDIKTDKFTETRLPKSPIDGVDAEMTYGHGQYVCPHSGEPLYSTDALRLHELMNDSGTCGEMYGQVMSTFEKLFLVHLLRSFEQKGWLATLRRVAFIIDGPLAVFSTASWLAKAIAAELTRINEKQKKINQVDMMVVGMEKSGTFFNHFLVIDKDSEGNAGKFPKQTAFLLTDKYIKNNIIYSESMKPYGEDTYFGRKFFYKAASGQLLVPVDICFNDYQRDLSRAETAQFVRLGDLMHLLDNIASSRYPNSITPLISAHAEAAIPLNMGKKIFEEMVRKINEEG